MAFAHKPNTGAVFPNAKKTTDNHPDRTGSALIGGVEYWVSGWIKDGKNGGKWLSLSFTPKEKGSTQRRAPSPRRDDDDDRGPPF